MKVLLTLGLVLLLSGCKLSYPVSQASGKDDVAYLLFTSPKTYAKKDVKVTLDGKTVFNARVVKERDSKRKGTTYSIGTGRKKLKVEHEGKTLYEKEIFVSTQETKQIALP